MESYEVLGGMRPISVAPNNQKKPEEAMASQSNDDAGDKQPMQAEPNNVAAAQPAQTEQENITEVQPVEIKAESETEVQPVAIAQDEVKNISTPDSECSGVSEDRIRAIVEECEKPMMSDCREIKETVNNIKEEIEKMTSYAVAVDSLRKSIFINRDNEEKLRKELDSYKNDERFKQIKPFLMMVVQMHSELDKSRAEYSDPKCVEELGEAVCKEIVDALDYLIGMVEAQMQVQGITVNDYEEGTSLIVTEQIIVKTVPTDVDENVGKIAVCKSKAYIYEGTVLQKAKVFVYKK